MSRKRHTPHPPTQVCLNQFYSTTHIQIPNIHVFQAQAKSPKPPTCWGRLASPSLLSPTRGRALQLPNNLMKLSVGVHSSPTSSTKMKMKQNEPPTHTPVSYPSMPRVPRKVKVFISRVGTTGGEGRPTQKILLIHDTLYPIQD